MENLHHKLAEIQKNFGLMIVGIKNAPSLTAEEKEYIIDLLEDELQGEKQCLVLTSGLPEEELLEAYRTIYLDRLTNLGDSFNTLNWTRAL